jgi:hypothetical protein
MARAKLSEYAAKSILQKEGLLPSWKGMKVTSDTTSEAIATHFGPNQKLVVKVDQGIKQRGKKGLLKVGVTPVEVRAFVQGFPAYKTFLAETVVPHDSKDEHYLSLERVRGGFQLLLYFKWQVRAKFFCPSLPKISFDQLVIIYHQFRRTARCVHVYLSYRFRNHTQKTSK